MKRETMRRILRATLAVAAVSLSLGSAAQAYLKPDKTPIGPGDTPDYLTTPNWAYSPPLRKFIDPLPGLTSAGANGLVTPGGDPAGQYIPVAVPDIVTYPGSDYYELELRQFSERMHSDLSPTTLRGYIQVNTGTNTSACSDPSLNLASPCTLTDNTVAPPAYPHYLGPLIISQKDRPVRVKFINKLPTGPDGKLFIPVDETIMGAGMFEIDYDPVTKQPRAKVSGTFSQNRGELHLHGGRTPWISDGTPHQWITPAGEVTDYPVGVSVENVPDMPNPGAGAQTYYWTNQQSSRMLFYHDHAWGITRLNVYVGEAAGYLIRDNVEKQLITDGIIPASEIPLVIQDKTYVDPATIGQTDPTWNWGITPGTPVKGDFWWPHVYMPAQNPFDITGIAPMGRWAYGPYFWPATNNPYQPIPNPYYNAACDPGFDPTPGDALTPADITANTNNIAGYSSINGVPYCQPPEIPSSPNPSWGAEAFMDTPIVNGTAYPVMNVDPKPYRLRMLNAAHDRFLNLQLYQADATVDANTLNGAACTAAGGPCATETEVKMLPAIDRSCPGINCDPTWPATWPADMRPGGIPDWNTAGPSWIMIGTEGGFLPKPVVIPNQPVDWNADPTTFNAGNVNAGSLILGPAERADVIVDFSQFAGKTLILYNDAPAPWPALDPHYDYYTGAPDNRDMGGADTTLPGLGPNTRTIMQIKVGTNNQASFNLTNLMNAFKSTGPNTGVFERSQDPLIVGQGNMNPSGDPAYYEAFVFPQDFAGYNEAYNKTFPSIYPNWGVSRINDKVIYFTGSDGSTTYNYNPDDTTPLPWDPTKKTYGGIPMKFKAIQDEQGETFDDYGRMRAALGLELITPGAGRVNFIVQTYSDPSTEILEENGIQVWKITHNGVDTHPVHFHLFDVQILNRVGWDGFIRLPDPTEMGWKDTVRISPLEDTIIALKPVTPKVPFGVPESYRPKNPATILGSTTELSTVDPTTGQAWAQPNLNSMINLKWEYVWHCHILSHEENDMMRPIQFNFVSAVPDTPVLTGIMMNGGNVVMTWTDSTPPVPANLGLAKNEIGFGIERCAGSGCSNFARIDNALANSTTYFDSTASGNTHFTYRVFAYNAAGQSPPSNSLTVNINSVNGQCGPSNGGTFTTVPAIGLCTVGAPFNIAGTGPWTWSCDGLNEGVPAACSANIQTYTVNFAAGTGGTITGTTPQTVNHGGTATAVTAVANAGFTFGNWTDQFGQVVGTSATLTLTNVVSNLTVTANFLPNYNVTLAKCMSGPTVVASGAMPTYTFNATGFGIQAFVNGSPVTVTSSAYTFPFGITADQVFTVNYTANPVGATSAVRLVKPNSTFTEYATLQAAYNAAASGDTIRLKAGTVTGTFTADRAISVKIVGGYEATFTTNCGFTTINGRVNLNRGTVSFNQVKR